MQNTDKIHIQHLAAICAQKGIEKIVLSPGSRCAPLVIAFNRHPDLECFSIVDERSAAFFALGMAQQTGKAVALICTSGSAVLNYAPAVAEAYYQKVPLLLLTADRPNEWIDQGENQSIQQFEVFKNYIKKSYQLPVNVSSKEDLWFCDRLISEAINVSTFPDFGPVHINIPLREPLYNLVEAKEDLQVKIVDVLRSEMNLNQIEKEGIQSEWKEAKKKLIVVGQSKFDKNLNELLIQLSEQKDVVVLYESISNLDLINGFSQIDPLVEYIEKNDLSDFVPDLVLTFGNGIVSKKLKFWLRKAENIKHWHISKSFEHWDNFQALSKLINTEASQVLNALLSEQTNATNYHKIWSDLNAKVQTFSTHFLENIDYADFKVFNILNQYFPKNTNLHFGNSTPVRYANLLNIDSISVNANRGVSGIDGQVSTALGASNVNNQLTLCITGDLAMMYDSNALWNNYLQPNFKIILINNSGGNIFKIIPGPGNLEEVDKYFETDNKYEAKHLCKLHDLDYFSAETEEEVHQQAELFFAKNEKACLFEIKTDGNLSASVLKKYFKELIKI